MAGNDVIADYAAGDVISLGAEVESVSLNSSSVVFKFDGGKLTVKNAKAKYLSMIDSAGNEYETVVGGRTTLTDSSKASVTMGAKVTTADATARTKAITISGNALPNTIYGGSGNDSIQLGIRNEELGIATVNVSQGNDTIQLKASSYQLTVEGFNVGDVIKLQSGNLAISQSGNLVIAGDGKDVIFGFSDEDALTLDDLTFEATASATTITLTVEGGTITLRNYTATTFNINGESYQVSDASLVKK